MSGSRSYQSPYKGSQIDEAVETVLGGTLVDVDSEQEVSNKNFVNNSIDANNNTVANLGVENIKGSEISYYLSANDYPEEFPNEVKIATDLLVNTTIPLIGESYSNQPIAMSEYAEDFYQMGFQIRDGVTILNTTNSIVNPFISTNVYGDYNYNIIARVYCPDFTFSNIKDDNKASFTIEDSPKPLSQENTCNYLIPLKRYTLFRMEVNHHLGIPENKYQDTANSRVRNYSLLETGSSPKPFIPITLYGVNITTYNQQNEVMWSHDGACTLEAGNEGDTFEGEEVFPEWFRCRNTSRIEDMIWGDPATVEVKYNGRVYQCWEALGQGEPWSLENLDDRNPNAEYKEVLLPYNDYQVFQEVQDSQGHIGYCTSFWWNIDNTESGYANQPETEVGDWETIYKSLIPSNNPETWENTGDFKWKFRMFKSNYPYDLNKRAYYAYQLVATDNPDVIRWAATEGAEGTPCTDEKIAGNPNEVQWAYEDNPAWYHVTVLDGEGAGADNVYVLAREIEGTPSVGDFVPESIGLFWNKDTNQFFRDAGHEDTQIASTTEEYRYGYTGETAFVVDGEVDDDAAPYFSENNWGIFKNNHDGTYTKISEAYYWTCVSAYMTPIIDLGREFRSTGKADFEAPNGDYIGGWMPDISNGYWWTLKAWEVEDQSGLKGWTPIPPIGSNPSSDFTEFANQEYENGMYTPMKADGSMLTEEIDFPFFYTGNYDPDFLGRYTDFQNGEL